MSSIRDLRNRSKSLLENLKKSSTESNSYGDKDTRFWYPKRDEAGNGSAIIRFIPQKNIEENPYIRLYSRAFKGGTGKWYIENDLSTIGATDPIGESNSVLWNSGNESDKAVVKPRNRKTNYIANVYIINDNANPENNGKVFLYKFGKSILAKLNALLTPEFDDEQPIVAFDYWGGCNFRLRVRDKDGFPNYDNSSFDPQSALFDDDDKIEAVHALSYDLSEFIAPTNFKDYETLKAHFIAVVGKNDAAVQAMGWDGGEDKPARKAKAAAVVDDGDEETPVKREVPKKSTTKAEAPIKKSTPPVVESDDDDEDYYRKLLDSV
jgi:hypothetical protein